MGLSQSSTKIEKINYMYDDINYSNLNTSYINNEINIDEKYIKNTDEYVINDFDGIPLNNTYQKVLNILSINQTGKNIFVTNDNDDLIIGFICNNELIIVQCEKLNSILINNDSIIKTINYLIQKNNSIDDYIPKCIRKIFIKKIISDIDFMKPIEDADIIIVN
jgi:hypothetical protein